MFEILYSIKFEGIAKGEKKLKEYSFELDTHINADSADEAHMIMQNRFDNDAIKVMSGECDETYCSMDEIENTAILFENVSWSDGEIKSGKMTTIVFPDGEGFPHKQDGKQVKYFVTYNVENCDVDNPDPIFENN